MTTKRLQNPLIPLQKKEEPLTTATTEKPIGDIQRDSSVSIIAQARAAVNAPNRKKTAPPDLRLLGLGGGHCPFWIPAAQTPRLADNSAIRTGSTDSIAGLLENVNTM